MKFPVVVTIFFFTLAAACLPLDVHAQSATSDKPLSAYRDKNRVLIVFAPSPQDDSYKEQMKIWQPEKSGFEDRQLVVVPVFANAKNPSAKVMEPLLPLIKKYGVDANAFTIVLIGKDGRDAYHVAKPVSVATLYGVIDAMPMRRAEMKRSPSPTPVPTPRRPDLDHDE